MAPLMQFFGTVSILSLLACSTCCAQLSTSFYSETCPNLETIVHGSVAKAVNNEPRLAASILRLHYLDCIVNGCDGSILLDDKDNFVGEKNAASNKDSVRGFELIDTIKTRVEAACRDTVSCADILALAARDGVGLVGGPSWEVLLGRRDAITASQSAANSQIPSPYSNLATLISMFEEKGLSARDLTALSGAHTIGEAQCKVFRDRIYKGDNINTKFATLRKSSCFSDRGDTNLSPLDLLTPVRFDNSYFKNLVALRGLLESDQMLFNRGSQDALVRLYSENITAFFVDFGVAMVKMGNIRPLIGTDGQIRKNCRVVN